MPAKLISMLMPLPSVRSNQPIIKFDSALQLFAQKRGCTAMLISIIPNGYAHIKGTNIAHARANLGAWTPPRYHIVRVITGRNFLFDK